MATGSGLSPDTDPDAPSDGSSMGVYFAPKSFHYSSVGDELTKNDHCISVVAVGSKFLYVLPGFDVLAVEMRHIQTKGSGRIGKEEGTYDLFIKNDASLSGTYPCEMLIKDLTIIKEEEFKQGVITDELQLPPQGVVVIWEWEWVEDDVQSLDHNFENSVDHVSETSVSHISETSLGDSDETNCSIADDANPLKFTVTFKCIGTQHDMHAQSILSKVSKMLRNGQEVPVNIYPEPDNPYDASAIAFKCWVDDKWHRIGYVVREALDCVHDALHTRSITEVRFAWAKYLLTWMRSGPGYYAGINITRYGQWSPEVCRSASTR